VNLSFPKPFILSLLLLLTTTSVSLHAATSRNPALPVELQKGLVLHLDADEGKSLRLSEDGRVVGWKDLSPAKHDAALGSAQGPLLVRGALNGRSVLRFGGTEFFKSQLAGGAGGLSVFAVFRRDANQASQRRWQRVLSGWDGTTPNDNAAPSFLLDTNGSGAAMPPTILSGLLPDNTYRGAIEIGRNAAKKGEFLEGDLCEVLVFDRSFLTYDPIQAINDYFVAKWA